MAKSGEQRAEILEGLLVHGVRPEKASGLLPRDRSSAMQHEIGQQVLEAGPVEASDGLVGLKQAKQVEQVEVQACGCHLFASVCEWARNSMWRADHAHYNMGTTGGQCASWADQFARLSRYRYNCREDAAKSFLILIRQLHFRSQSIGKLEQNQIAR